MFSETSVIHSRLAQLVLALGLSVAAIGVGPAGPSEARVARGSTVEVQVAGEAGIPANASAVAVNLAAVNPAGDGFLTAYPCGSGLPGTSTLNHDTSRATSNSTIVKVGDGGKICVYTLADSDVVVDVTGWFPAGADFTAIAPARLLDTRPNQRRLAGSDLELQVASRFGIPANASAVAVNLAAVNPAGDGFLTAYPCGTNRPETSTVNHDSRPATSNSTVVKLGTGGKICLYTLTESDVVVDVTGWFPAGADFTAMAPARLLDTRANQRRSGGSTLELQVANRNGIPSNASAVALNLAAVTPSGAGFITAFPCGATRPETATVNHETRPATSNSTIVKIGAGGKICLYTLSATDIVVDVTGWFPAGADFTAIDPDRAVDTRPPEPPPPPPPPPGSGHFATLPVGAALPSGATCAAQVRDAVEIRPGNAAANNNRGGRSYANNRTDWSEFDRIDGDFAGTTDEIIQWAACKWGLDEDMARAQVVKESWWQQSANGDNGESWGLGQVREPYHQSAFEFSAVNARNSSAYNLDYTFASWRACFEGVFTWLNTVERGATYGPGDAWGCMGVWYSGRWYTDAAIAYLEGGLTPGYGDRGVKQHFTLRTWEDPTFIAG
jgi:hypothetical protein